MTDPIGEFLDAMHRKGCAPDQRESIKPDDRIHGYTLLGDRPHKKAGSYRLTIINGRGIGWFRNHREGVTHNFVSGRAEYSAELLAEIKRRRAELDKERRQREKETARRAYGFYMNSPKADPAHEYLIRKKIQPHNLHQKGDRLLVPLTDIHGWIWNIQRIYPDKKLYLRGARITGTFCGLWSSKQRDIVIICEGFATGASIHEATDLPVLCAMQANNLAPVARAVRKKHPDTEIIIAADNDQWTKKQDGTPWNAGLHYARIAADEAQAAIAYPEFPADDPQRRTDFNDLEDPQALREYFGWKHRLRTITHTAKEICQCPMP